jgi:hypothetical protein
VPWLHLTDRKNLRRHAEKDAITTGDERFDSVYVLFANDEEYAKAAVSATVRSGLPAQSLSRMHIVDGRLFLLRPSSLRAAAEGHDRARYGEPVNCCKGERSCRTA